MKQRRNDEYEELKDRAASDHIHRLLEGKLTPTKKQVVEKLNRERKDHERRLERNNGK